MDFEIFPVTAFQQNCSLVVCPETRKAAFVDPGGDIEHLQAVAQQAGVAIIHLGVRLPERSSHRPARSGGPPCAA